MAYKLEDVRLSWQLETLSDTSSSGETTDVSVTQACVADIVGVNKSTVSDWVRAGVLRARGRRPVLAIRDELLLEFKHGTRRGRRFERWLEDVAARSGANAALRGARQAARLEGAKDLNPWKWGDIKQAGELTTLTELSAAYLLPSESVGALLEAHFIVPHAKAHRGENLYDPRSLGNPALIADVNRARKALAAPVTLPEPPYRDQGYEPPEEAPNPFWNEENAKAMGPRRPVLLVSKQEQKCRRRQGARRAERLGAQCFDDWVARCRSTGGAVSKQDVYSVGNSCALVTIEVEVNNADGVENGQSGSAGDDHRSKNVWRKPEPYSSLRCIVDPAVNLAPYAQNRRTADQGQTPLGAAPIR